MHYAIIQCTICMGGGQNFSSIVAYSSAVHMRGEVAEEHKETKQREKQTFLISYFITCCMSVCLSACLCVCVCVCVSDKLSAYSIPSSNIVHGLGARHTRKKKRKEKGRSSSIICELLCFLLFWNSWQKSKNCHCSQCLVVVVSSHSPGVR